MIANNFSCLENISRVPLILRVGGGKGEGWQEAARSQKMEHPVATEQAEGFLQLAVGVKAEPSHQGESNLVIGIFKK